jgi:uncharacterized protein
MTDYHEPPEQMPESERDYVRALRSLIEEVEAVDWYQQRIACSKNEELKAVLVHNRDEEMEHASMTLEWLRRNMPGWDAQLRTYLFSEGDIPALGGESESGEAEPMESGLRIGGLRKSED